MIKFFDKIKECIMFPVNSVSPCKGLFLASIKVGALAGLAWPISLLWYEISSRWFHYYCPSPEVPRNIPFTGTFTIHQNGQVSTKKLAQTVQREVQKICGKDVQITKSSSLVSENHQDSSYSPTKFKLLSEGASGKKTVSYQCSVHGTEETVEQVVRDEVANTAKSLKEEKIHQNCDIVVQRSLYECDPTISLKCVLSNDFRNQIPDSIFDFSGRFLKLTHSQYSYPEDFHTKKFKEDEDVGQYANEGSFQLDEPVIFDRDFPSDIAQRNVFIMHGTSW